MKSTRGSIPANHQGRDWQGHKNWTVKENIILFQQKFAGRGCSSRNVSWKGWRGRPFDMAAVDECFWWCTAKDVRWCEKGVHSGERDFSNGDTTKRSSVPSRQKLDFWPDGTLAYSENASIHRIAVKRKERRPCKRDMDFAAVWGEIPFCDVCGGQGGKSEVGAGTALWSWYTGQRYKGIRRKPACQKR